MKTGLFHPSKIVTGAIGSATGGTIVGRTIGRTVGRTKRWVVKRLYEHLARAHPVEFWTTMNYGYVPVPGLPEPVPMPDGSTDGSLDVLLKTAPERCGLHLYWRVVTAGLHGASLAGCDVLEIGSGRGGGAAFVAQALQPRRMVGLDIAEHATALANQRYAAQPNLQFVQGDAENLAFDDASFDAVINVESLHCYASVPRFLSEVERVLKPGGELLVAAFAARRGGAYERLIAALDGSPNQSPNESPLTLKRLDDITPNVLASLKLDEARKRDLINRTVKGPMRSFAIGAYAMEGSAMRRALEAGDTVYFAAVLGKQ